MTEITKEFLESYAELELQHSMTEVHAGPEMHPSILRDKPWGHYVLTDSEKLERMRKMFCGESRMGISNRSVEGIWTGFVKAD